MWAFASGAGFDGQPGVGAAALHQPSKNFRLVAHCDSAYYSDYSTIRSWPSTSRAIRVALAGSMSSGTS